MVLLVTIVAITPFVSNGTNHVQAADYPSCFFYEDSNFENLIVSYKAPVGETVAIRMYWFAEYNNEGYDINIYNSETNKLVFSTSSTFSNTNYTRKITEYWNTNGLEPGEYKAEVTLKFYSLYRWNDAPNKKKLYITLEACPHEWDSGIITKNATCVGTGTKTFTCLKCATFKDISIPKLTPTIKLSATKKSIKKKKSYTLAVSNLGKGDSVKSVVSSKKGVATVKKVANNKYKITGKKKGKAVITVKLKSGKTGKCTVTVK